jgi:hypothetical protein
LLLPAPVLAAACPGLAAWTWAFADPATWLVFTIPDGGVAFELVTALGGVARQFSPVDGNLPVFIVGADAGGNEITARSNVVVPADAQIINELTAYWPMEEAAGEDRIDSLNGISLCEHAVGESLYDVGMYVGIIGGAAYFDERYLMCLTTADLPDVTGGDFSFAFWLAPLGSSYLSQTVVDIGNTVKITLDSAGDSLIFGVATDTWPYGFAVQTAADTLGTSGWTHVACVRQDSSLKIYLNGVLSAAGGFSGAVALDENPSDFGETDLIVGCADSDSPLNAAVDELGIWSRALAAADVAWLYNHGSGQPYALF